MAQVSFLQALWKILKSLGWLLFAITVLGSSLDQWLTGEMETQLSSPLGASSQVWLYGALSLLLNLLYPLLLSLLILSCLQTVQPGIFVRQFFSAALREQMRAWGKAMLWSLALIVPGLWRFFRYVFVPFVVCFDPEYPQGKIDALEKSTQLSRGKMPAILSLFVFFGLLLPALLTSVDEYKTVWKTPLSALLLCALEMSMNICFILALWKLYQKHKVEV